MIDGDRLPLTKDLADTLRTAIERSPYTLIELAERSGVTISRISEFLSGGDMRLRNAGKLARVLNLELKPKSKRKRA